MAKQNGVETVSRLVAIDSLQAHPRNYNKHSNDQIGRIAESLSTFGQVRAIIVWQGFILAGHGVWLAAKSLAWETIRVDDMSHLSEQQALAYVVADNELARRSDPDNAQLAAILEDLNRYEPALVTASVTKLEMDQLINLVRITAPDVQPQKEPSLPADCFIEIYCAQEDLADFQDILDEWGDRPTVTVNIS